MDEDVPGKQSCHPRQKSRRAELGEGVLAPICRHHVVAGLCTAVEAYDRGRLAVAGQVIDQQSLAGVAETQVDYCVSKALGGTSHVNMRKTRPANEPPRPQCSANGLKARSTVFLRAASSPAPSRTFPASSRFATKPPSRR